MSSDFDFGDVQRWSFGWYNPNAAGLFFACIIPALIWLRHELTTGMTSRRILFLWCGLCAEVAILAIIAKTGSRGALVAVVVGFSYFACLGFPFSLAKRYEEPSRSRRAAGALLFMRLVALGILVSGFGMLGRIDPRFVSNDMSSINRLELWSGCLRLISSRPFSTIGILEGGEALNQWVFPIGSNVVPQSMQNIVLDIAMGQGGIVAILCVAASIVISTMPWVIRSSERVTRKHFILSAAAATFVIYLTGNAFSSLYQDTKISAVGVTAVVFVVFLTPWRTHAIRIFGILALSIFISAVLALVAVGVGRKQNQEQPIQLSIDDDGRVYLSKRSKEPLRTVHVYPDNVVLTRFYGHSIRRLLQGDYTPTQWIVHPANSMPSALSSLAKGDLFLFFGDQCIKSNFAPPKSASCAVFPGLKGTPVSGFGKNCLVIENSFGANPTSKSDRQISPLNLLSVLPETLEMLSSTELR